MTRTSLQLVLACSAAVALRAQAPAAPAAKDPISDNSFFIEESYNQEAGVVQHISAFTRMASGKGWAYTFTQEWPVPGERHQLSYTLPITNLGSGATTGLGDLMINYRYQALHDEKSGFAFSPRLSVSLPTGDKTKGLGMGGTGWQVNLPVSKTLGESFVAHTNAGATWFSKAPGAGDASTSVHAVNVGQSVIWLATPRFNVMLESVWTRTTTSSKSGDHADETAFIIPGIRWGYDFKSGLQVVPGIGMPIGVGRSSGTHQLFLYLSFEHPFTAAARAEAQK